MSLPARTSMLLLALDTSGPQVVAALHDGARLLAQRSAGDGRHHAELLGPAIADVLAEAGAVPGDLTDVVVGVGPGPFTGLRVGLVTARVLGAALVVPVRGVCSLDVVAEAAVASGAVDAGQEFLVATDARRREVYWAGYRVGSGGGWERTADPDVAVPAALPRNGRVVLGRGALLYPDVLGPDLRSPALPEGTVDVTGAALAGLAVRLLAEGSGLGGSAWVEPQPLYLRRPDAVEPGARKRVLQ